MPEGDMNVKEAAEYLGILPSTLQRKTSEGKVPAYKPGRSWVYDKQLLDEWRIAQMKANVVDPAAPKPTTGMIVRPAGRKRGRRRNKIPKLPQLTS